MDGLTCYRETEISKPRILGTLAGADPVFDQGGPDHDRPKLPTVHSSVV